MDGSDTALGAAGGGPADGTPWPRAGAGLRYGDEVADLYARHAAGLLRLAELLCGDRALAEELVQEAFVRSWRHWRRVRGSGSELAYVRQTLVNLTRDSFRRRFREARQRLLAPPAATTVEPDVDGRVDLERALARLPLRKRACVVLRYYADLSEEDTARLLGISVGTVKSQTHRALGLLARDLDATTVRR
jgi:RNA polymerase sigma-70 factor (sigma-E family)